MNRRAEQVRTENRIGILGGPELRVTFRCATIATRAALGNKDIMPTTNASRARALFVIASLLLLLCVAGCVRGASPQREQAGGSAKTSSAPQAVPPLSSAPVAQGFVGNMACAPCHAQAFRDHQHSRHAVTLHLASRADLGRLAPRPAPLPGGKARVEQAPDGDGYKVVIPATGRAGPLQYVLGSGKSGMTYVTLMGSHLFEMRASYFPGEGKWKVTPGQEAGVGGAAMGADHSGEEARQCIACHAVTLPDNSNTPEKRFFGVGCESCHGAGGRHVAAMQTGAGSAGDIRMARLGQWDARRLNELCGKCHRNADAVDASPDATPDLSVTSRFQPYALMLSRCFKESGSRLSCAACHNPHQNTSRNQQVYEAVCLNCHTGKQVVGTEPETGKQAASLLKVGKTTREPSETETKQDVAGTKHMAPPHAAASARVSVPKVCPVNARTGCIGCHMPRKQVMSTALIGTTAPDHFIRVRRPTLEAKWARDIATPATQSMSLP